MGFIKNALGMIGDAATGGLASGVGSFVSGILGDRGLSKKDQLEIMNKQHGYELENMDYQAKLNEEMAQRNQERQNEYFGMTAEYNSAKNQKQRLEDAGSYRDCALSLNSSSFPCQHPAITMSDSTK